MKRFIKAASTAGKNLKVGDKVRFTRNGREAVGRVTNVIDSGYKYFSKGIDEYPIYEVHFEYADNGETGVCHLSANSKDVVKASKSIKASRSDEFFAIPGEFYKAERNAARVRKQVENLEAFIYAMKIALMETPDEAFADEFVSDAGVEYDNTPYKHDGQLNDVIVPMIEKLQSACFNYGFNPSDSADQDEMRNYGKVISDEFYQWLSDIQKQEEKSLSAMEERLLDVDYPDGDLM